MTQNWLFYALLAPVIFTVVNFIDKFLVHRHVPNPLAMSTYVAITSLLSGTIVWLLTGRPTLELDSIVLIFLTGSLLSVAAVIYFVAMSREEASRIIVLNQLIPIFVLALSFIFIREPITGEQLIGFFLILAAAIGVSVAQGEGVIKMSPAFFLMLISTGLTAINIILIDHITRDIPVTTVLSYEAWGIGLSSFVLYLIYPPIRRAFHQNLQEIHKPVIGLILVGESLYIVSKLATFMAISLGVAALVSVLASTQVFLGILAGWALTILAPTIFKEDISRSGLAAKGVLAAVMFAGLLMVSQVTSAWFPGFFVN
jgi:drug/metabolite transporter (DMT)-like permease